MIRSAVWVCLLAAPVWGNCVGGTAMGSFRLAVAGSGGTLPLRSLDGLAAGQTLRYEPVRLPGGMDKAEVALILVHGVNRWTVYPPQSAAQPAEWLAP